MLDGLSYLLTNRQYSWMPQVKDPEKRRAISEAVVTEAVEYGLASISMDAVARRAGVSKGTLYLYYKNKDEMLQEVYMEIKYAFATRMDDAIDGLTGSEQIVRVIWFELFQYVLDNPEHHLYAEYISSTQLLDSERQKEVAALTKRLHKPLRAAIKDGTIVDIPIATIQALFVAPAFHLAKHHVMAGKKPVLKSVDQAYQLIWAGLSTR